MLHSLKAKETMIADDQLRINGFALSLIAVGHALQRDKSLSLSDQ
jgi:hypothetical protein